MATPRLNIQTGIIVCAVLYGGYKIFDKPSEYDLEKAKHLAPPSREKRAIENKAYLEKTREYSEARAKGLAAPVAPALVPTPAPTPTALPAPAPAPAPTARTQVTAPVHYDAPPPQPTSAPAAPNPTPGRGNAAVGPDEDEDPKTVAEQTKPKSLKERLEQRGFTAKKKTAD